MGYSRLFSKRILTFALVLTGLAAGLAACSTPGPIAKIEGSGAIGIFVEKSWPQGTSPVEKTDKVYFIRLNGDENLTKQSELFHSNFHRDGQVYLLNAKPGRYVVVAASDSIQNPGIPRGLDPLRGLDEYKVFTTYFDEALVKKSELVVNPDQLTLAGNYLVTMKNAVHFGDKIQRHFYKVVNPTITDPYGAPVIGEEVSDTSRASLLQDRGGREWELQFLDAAKGHLAGSAWAKLAQDRIETLRKK